MHLAQLPPNFHYHPSLLIPSYLHASSAYPSGISSSILHHHSLLPSLPLCRPLSDPLSCLLATVSLCSSSCTHMLHLYLCLSLSPHPFLFLPHFCSSTSSLLLMLMLLHPHTPLSVPSISFPHFFLYFHLLLHFHSSSTFLFSASPFFHSYAV